ncbi:MAG TPA: glycosyltransferase [Rubrobacteraceae bacterium]|nr:glycosyltransferase [Rubrobacteraceae bacterium]
MSQRAVAVVPARDEADRIQGTIESLSGIPMLLRIIVVDDGSADATAKVAGAAGAQVLSSTPSGRPAGKGRALISGLRHARTLGPDAFLLADADLGPSAAGVASLLGCLSPKTPAAIAVFPRAAATGGGFGAVKSFSRHAIARRNTRGFVPAEPLSGQRAMTAPALDALPGLAPGFGVEVGMTLDWLAADIVPVEVEIPLSHRPTGRSISGFAHRARQGLDILRALHGTRLPW